VARRIRLERYPLDVAGILMVSSEEMGRACVAQWAEELGLTEIWDAILKRISAAP